MKQLQQKNPLTLYHLHTRAGRIILYVIPVMPAPRSPFESTDGYKTLEENEYWGAPGAMIYPDEACVSLDKSVVINHKKRKLIGEINYAMASISNYSKMLKSLETL